MGTGRLRSPSVEHDALRDLLAVVDAELGTLFAFIHRRCGDRALAEDLAADVVLRAVRETKGAWPGAAKESESSHIVMTIAVISTLTQDACHAQRPQDPPVGPTVDDLVLALSQLSPFEVSEPATDI